MGCGNPRELDAPPLEMEEKAGIPAKVIVIGHKAVGKSTMISGLLGKNDKKHIATTRSSAQKASFYADING